MNFDSLEEDGWCDDKKVVFFIFAGWVEVQEWFQDDLENIFLHIWRNGNYWTISLSIIYHHAGKWEFSKTYCSTSTSFKLNNSSGSMEITNTPMSQEESSPCSSEDCSLLCSFSNWSQFSPTQLSSLPAQLNIK